VSEEGYPNERPESSKTIRNPVDLFWTSAENKGSREFKLSFPQEDTFAAWTRVARTQRR
jgi:hypothetical protein